MIKGKNGKDMESKFGPTEPSKRACGRMIWLMERGSIFTSTVIYMMENGSKGKTVAMVNIPTLMAQNIKN